MTTTTYTCDLCQAKASIDYEDAHLPYDWFLVSGGIARTVMVNHFCSKDCMGKYFFAHKGTMADPIHLHDKETQKEEINPLDHSPLQ